MPRTKKAKLRDAERRDSEKRDSNRMSRQPPPPLPRGLPSRPPPPASSYQLDSYRSSHETSYRPPNDRDRYPSRDAPPPYQFRGSAETSTYRPAYDRPPSPPRYGYPPGTGPQTSSYRPSYDHPPAYERPRSPPRDSYSSHRDAPNSNDRGFDFRYDAPPGLDHSAADTYRPRAQPRRNEQGRNTGAQRGGARGGYRGRAGPRLASDRDFLKTNRAPTPEMMPGMEETEGNTVKFRAVIDLSDSEEADMDLSDNENEADQPKKKQARTGTMAADGDSVPRWSNPDPYTALPPPDETQKKKLDVVKLIRKARVTDTAATSKAGAATDDFISFDFDDDEEDSQQEPKGIEGAPTGPKFSHRDNTHGQSQANGQNLASAAPQPVRGDINHQPRQIELPSAPRIDENSRPTNKAPGQKSTPIDLTSDPALGSRKRNIRDEIKPPPSDVHAPIKVKGPSPNGEIHKFWLPKQGVSPTPWLTSNEDDSATMGVRLHKEIMDFYHYVKPREFEERIRTKLVDDLRARVRKAFHEDDDIRAFGSFPAGLYLPTADMDLVLVSREYMTQGREVYGRKFLFKFGPWLERNGFATRGSVETIAGARVPIVKYIDRVTGLKVDISFESDTGIIANTTFQNWKTIFPAMPILVTLIKHILTMRGLNEPVNGGIGGFSVTCLVVSLLQNMPQVQSRTMIPEHHLGEIFMEFLDLYGNQFDTVTTGITLNPPGYFLKKLFAAQGYNRGPNNKFMIIDPNNSGNDIAGGSKNTSTILRTFSQAFTALQARMVELQNSPNNGGQSILGEIIAADYSSFERQREHLAHLHEKLFGPIRS